MGGMTILVLVSVLRGGIISIAKIILNLGEICNADMNKLAEMPYPALRIFKLKGRARNDIYGGVLQGLAHWR